MGLLQLSYSIVFLVLACLGLGLVALRPFSKSTQMLNALTHLAVAYYLGQGLLASLLLLVGLYKQLTPNIILIILNFSSLGALFILFKLKSKILNDFKIITHVMKSASKLWLVLAIIMFVFLASGVSTFFGGLAGDAYAFYLPLAKFMSASHSVAPLPGYEHFGSIGFYAEILLASLYSLGLPDASPRYFSFINQLPGLIILYTLSRECRLTRRAALLVLIMVVTSSAGVLLWSSGKTDLFAVGPSFAAILFAVFSWNRSLEKPSLLLSGYFLGLASVFKLSYIVPFFPMVFILICWKEWFVLFQIIRLRNWHEIKFVMFIIFKKSLLVGGGCLISFLPHFLKNFSLNVPLIGGQDIGSYYSNKTTLRLVMTYPFALTFGNYWAQLGTISPLILGFIPTILITPKPLFFSESKLGAISVAAFLGLICWISLFPSIFMPRYFLSVIFILAIPAAAAASFLIQRSRSFMILSVISVIIVLLSTRSYTNLKSSQDGFCAFSEITSARLFGNGEASFLYAPETGYSLAHKAINKNAKYGDRVFLYTYYRLWLRPDLLISASTNPELQVATNGKSDFWMFVREKKFRFILWDKNIFKLDPKQFDSPPADIHLKVVYKDASLIAYEIEG